MFFLENVYNLFIFSSVPTNDFEEIWIVYTRWATGLQNDVIHVCVMQNM